MRSSGLFMLPAVLVAFPACARTLVCVPAADVLRASADGCVAGHVYDVVTVEGGARFLDLCSPETPDESCRISVVSYGKDRRQVGDLEALRGKEVAVRGAVEKFGERFVVVLNDERQLHGGAARFTPDPRLRGKAREDDTDENAKELKVNFHHHGRKLEKE